MIEQAPGRGQGSHQTASFGPAVSWIESGSVESTQAREIIPLRRNVEKQLEYEGSPEVKAQLLSNLRVKELAIQGEHEKAQQKITPLYEQYGANLKLMYISALYAPLGPGDRVDVSLFVGSKGIQEVEILKKGEAVALHGSGAENAEHISIAPIRGYDKSLRGAYVFFVMKN